MTEQHDRPNEAYAGQGGVLAKSRKPTIRHVFSCILHVIAVF
jgi:hypothetical protein